MVVRIAHGNVQDIAHDILAHLSQRIGRDRPKQMQIGFMTLQMTEGGDADCRDNAFLTMPRDRLRANRSVEAPQYEHIVPIFCRSVNSQPELPRCFEIGCFCRQDVPILFQVAAQQLDDDMFTRVSVGDHTVRIPEAVPCLCHGDLRPFSLQPARTGRDQRMFLHHIQEAVTAAQDVIDREPDSFHIPQARSFVFKCVLHPDITDWRARRVQQKRQVGRPLIRVQSQALAQVRRA